MGRIGFLFMLFTTLRVDEGFRIMVHLWKTGKQQHMAQRGQALVEYALIVVLVVFALAAALVATGPALGNVFSNTVCNLLDQTANCSAIVNVPNLSGRGGPSSFWLTVTAVALNPPPTRQFPINVNIPNTVVPPTFDPNVTPPTPVPSRIPPPTPTVTPSATPSDQQFIAPHYDPINEPPFWRVDQSLWLGGDDWRAAYFPNRTLGGQPDRVVYLYNELGIPLSPGLDFLWDSNPIDAWRSDDFSIRFVRRIYLEQPTSLTFTLATDDGGRLYINPANYTSADPSIAPDVASRVVDDWVDSSITDESRIFQHTVTLAAGSHWIVAENYDNTGTAGIRLNVTAPKENIDADVNLADASRTPNCAWTHLEGNQSSSLTFAWKDSPLRNNPNGFPTNTRCHLELRGGVSIANLNPTAAALSFYDVWDFGSLTDTTVRVQIAAYNPYSYEDHDSNAATPMIQTDGPDWANGVTYTIRRSGKNYAWTRNEFLIPASLGQVVTFRFIIDSGAATGRRVWYMDDVRVENASTRTFGICSGNPLDCGSYWDLDNPDQKNDFITTGRWDLTTANTAANTTGGTSLSWDSVGTARSTDNPNPRYVNFGDNQATTDFRIHTVEMNGRIDLRGIDAAGNGGSPDFEDDSGMPILSYYQAYSIAPGERIVVQYTRDDDNTSDNNGAPAVWTDVPNGTPINNTGTSTLTRAMEKVELRLNNIPNWNTSPFRLRFALFVNGDSQTSAGLFLDNIAVEREGIVRYANYPFCDGAEEGLGNWVMGGQWGISNTLGRYSNLSFADSPQGNYLTEQITTMSIRYAFDFNNDTPENLALGGNRDCNDATSSAAANPILTFFHQRSISTNNTFSVEINRRSRGAVTAIAPTTIWSIANTPSSPYGTNRTWEQVEIDLRFAIENATSSTWAALTSNTERYDDDFFITFKLNTQGASNGSDGLHIDDIRVNNRVEEVFRVWDPATNVAGLGTGSGYVFIEDAEDDWYNRVRYGGNWYAVDWEVRRGAQSYHESENPGTSYRHQTFNVLELDTIFDLRGTPTTAVPMLSFWTRYDIAVNDAAVVQVAVQTPSEAGTNPTTQPTRNRTGYDYIPYWGSSISYATPSSGQPPWRASSWERAMTITGRNDAWVLRRVDLSSYIGKRIRIRFALNALVDSAISQGWWIDDIRIELNAPRQITLPLIDQARNLDNWITEGDWGLAPDQWRGAGGGPASLPGSPWNAYFFDCINWVKSPSQPNSGAASLTDTTSCSRTDYNTLFNYIDRTVTATDQWISARPRLLEGTHRIVTSTNAINYELGTTGRPPGGTGNSTWFDSFAARFIRSFTAGAGNYTFITTSDDGVRLRLDDGTPPPLPTAPTYWNLINNWTDHGRMIDLNTVSLNGSYRLILEWFEGSGDAVLVLQVGSNRFSFTDSPKTADVNPSILYASSSLMLNGVINLAQPASITDPNRWKPRVEFYTLWSFREGSTGQSGRFEVSEDGGFTWTQGTRMGEECPTELNSGRNCNPNVPGSGRPVVWMPNEAERDSNGALPTSGGNPITRYNDWERRSLSLNQFIGRNITVRFLLGTGSTVISGVELGARDGWFVTDVSIRNSVGS
jgi:Flp pilus assembly pilin Flp